MAAPREGIVMPPELLGKGIIQKIEDPDALPESSLHFVLADYLAAIAEDGMIQRVNFNPADIPPDILPHLMIWDLVSPTGEYCRRDCDFRFRLMGSGLVEMLGFEMTGKLLSDFPIQTCKQYLLDNALLSEKHSRPVFSRTELEYEDGTQLVTDKAYYPLRHRDGLHGMLILFTAATVLDLHCPVIALGEPVCVEDYFRVLPAISIWN